MLVISVRQFTQNPNKYLNGLPVMLSRYGVPVAKITGLITEIKEEKREGVSTPVINQVPVPGSPKEKNNNLDEPIYDKEF